MIAGKDAARRRFAVVDKIADNRKVFLEQINFETPHSEWTEKLNFACSVKML